ncbi:hypothetical protein pEaSNUABM56_00104 [Erwinia phage pEa_SNUABM_56]|uniref:Uncharacterized protein n=1 Tax=Erwinia phage pEp_SNUABM_01 TaxID=2601643 RepID=A0A5J6DBA3_9CAUD|nr:hypothetical protein HWC63_gp077 [Erwinia phage pEp_SNUABM_01]QEQ94903.1 hypothetical protein pEpSNUABM01_077 [Erwinia phage pEp_SNUABM_01]UYL84833.1 hypothetical protein pEaSNUABM55_00035 [Erwinia phage pEa_SNUABM_55]UYL85149.1 hypothetical protein pEaSNUABM56_00104 [Erwinia phage pEa_SNUABM_56]
MSTLFSDLLLDPVTGDLDVSSGLQLIDTNVVSLRQRLYLRFNIWQGDWYFDETIGFPYRTYLGQKVMKTILDNKIKEITRLESDVLSINDFSSTMDRTGRSYEAYFEVLTVEQEIVRIAFMGSSDAYFYPNPDDATTPSSLCGEDGWVSWSNKLYYLVNFRLPRPGDSTWYNTWATN